MMSCSGYSDDFNASFFHDYSISFYTVITLESFTADNYIELKEISKVIPKVFVE